MDINGITRAQLADTIDHTLLRADAAKEELLELCRTAAREGFHSVAVNSCAAGLCSGALKGSGVVCAVTVGFPLGQTSLECKAFETREAVLAGAGEVDYVVDLSAIKSGDWAHAREEMERLTGICRELGAGIKVIFETCYLTEDEKKRLCEIACQVRPDFVKTSTGFGTPKDGRPSGATVEDIRLMKACVGDAVKIKASGGIRTTEKALMMLEAGASRIGTSSGVEIVRGLGA